jgi:Tol biopolymer transport system component
VQQAAGSSFAPTVSGDGRNVVFVSSAPLDGVFNRQRSAREAKGLYHVYLRNLHSSFIRRISHAPAGDDADGPSFHPAVSGDGRLVAFVSQASNLVPRDRNRVADVYLHDVHTGQTTLVSRSASGGSAAGSSHHPALSADGRFVAFVSDAADLACASRCPNRLLDLNLVADVYVFDTLTHAVARVSGARAKSPWWEASTGPSLDAAGRVIAFSSRHPIDPSDVKHDFDLFVEEMPRVRESTTHLDGSIARRFVRDADVAGAGRFFQDRRSLPRLWCVLPPARGLARWTRSSGEPARARSRRASSRRDPHALTYVAGADGPPRGRQSEPHARPRSPRALSCP